MFAQNAIIANSNWTKIKFKFSLHFLLLPLEIHKQLFIKKLKQLNFDEQKGEVFFQVQKAIDFLGKECRIEWLIWLTYIYRLVKDGIVSRTCSQFTTVFSPVRSSCPHSSIEIEHRESRPAGLPGNQEHPMVRMDVVRNRRMGCVSTCPCCKLQNVQEYQQAFQKVTAFKSLVNRLLSETRA